MPVPSITQSGHGIQLNPESQFVAIQITQQIAEGTMKAPNASCRSFRYLSAARCARSDAAGTKALRASRAVVGIRSARRRGSSPRVRAPATWSERSSYSSRVSLPSA